MASRMRVTALTAAIYYLHLARTRVKSGRGKPFADQAGAEPREREIRKGERSRAIAKNGFAVCLFRESEPGKNERRHCQAWDLLLLASLRRAADSSVPAIAIGHH